jgi:hypothetical protein
MDTSPILHGFLMGTGISLAALILAFVVVFGGALLWEQCVKTYRDDKKITERRKSIVPPKWPRW